MQEVFEKILKDLEGDSWLTTNDDGETNELSILVVSMDDAREIVESAAEVMGKYNQSETGFISRTECLKLIEDITCNPLIPKNYGTLLDILSAIRKMPATDTSRWFPCSESLPEEKLCEDGKYDPSEKVLIQLDNEEMFTSRYWGHRHSKDSDDFEKWIDLPDYYQDRVVAWQPLPESFKEKK